MLKALELNGFKSFADRTRFTFDPGITVVVGPNGSGKSNVVDAIKWALGSQSAKSLRGKEMADVIFSGSNGRRPGNSAEVTLAFDNSTRIFDVDADEVELTRRVYRSGEVEYLVNRQARRLRDLRDLLASGGMSTSAYCVIEQGKVDALLQSSAKQRRVIFEEAAGVSRFKNKREEAARRLERVEQNLLRLSDLVDELQTRLKTVRSQAGRARRYSETAERLKTLRVAIARHDYQKLARQIGELRSAGHQEQSASDAVEQRLADIERQIRGFDQEGQQLQLQLRDTTAADADIRQQIAHHASTQNSQLARVDELTLEAQRISRQVLGMATRAGDTQQLAEETIAEAQEAERNHALLAQQVAAGMRDIEESQRVLAEASQHESQVREQIEESTQQRARLEHQIQVLSAKMDTQHSTLARCEEQLEPLQLQAQRLQDAARQAQHRTRAADQELQQANQRLEAAQAEVARRRQRHRELLKQAAQLQQNLAAARERTVVLDELERRLDGLTAGAREAIRLARTQPDGPFGGLQGIVADLLQVDPDSAAMVEVALGDRANDLVITGADQLCRALCQLTQPWPGRTRFLRIDVPVPASAVDHIDLGGEPGVIGRADQFVDTAAGLETLGRRLLGRCWLVDSLPTALRLAADRGRGLNFVTAAGELVGADGTLVIGPRQNTTGLLSRRSELRALHEQIERLTAEVKKVQQESDAIEQAIASDDRTTASLTAQCQDLQRAAHDHHVSATTARHRMDQVAGQLEQIQGEHAAARTEADALAAERHESTQQLNQINASIAQSEESIRRVTQAMRQASQRLEQTRQSITDQRIDLARAEQRKTGLQRQIDQLIRDRDERDQSVAEMHERIEQCRTQSLRLQRSVLDLSSESAMLYAKKDQLAEQARKIEEAQHSLAHRRQQTLREADKLRELLLARQRGIQQAELKLQQLSHQQSAIWEKIREDYQIELEHLDGHSASTAASPPTEKPPPRNEHDEHPEHDEPADHAEPVAPVAPAGPDREDVADPVELDAGNRHAIEQEIEQLRERLQATGPVNLEALAELETLEERYGVLSQQHDDLREARRRLEHLVTHINSESRQLFVQTVDEIRGHFQEIFTTLFNGGEADILIESEGDEDVLECGISIVARPPGKQPRSISLLSGGERTLTCVALLLAVFRSRPSPFCVLDEVDAALDEANIDRFVTVLREFMKSTQFIVITHSKRTMSCSDTLYGVTMQESGVSKRVSVRFEDVGQDGHIRPHRTAETQSPGPQRQAA
jgi:chromosome segregation protein